MGTGGVNTAFCWRKRVRAERAKLQWPGGECECSWGFCLGRADAGRAAPVRQNCPKLKRSHLLQRDSMWAPHHLSRDGATAVSPAACMLLSKMVPRGLAPPLSLHPCSWDLSMCGLRGWMQFVVLEPLPLGWQSWKHLFLLWLLFSPLAVSGLSLCLSECHGFESNL